MKVLEFTKKADARAAQKVVHDCMCAHYAEQGYRVERGGVIGKNAATGEDAPNACRLTRWADEHHCDGGFYIPSPSKVDPEHRTRLAENCALPAEKEMIEETVEPKPPTEEQQVEEQLVKTKQEKEARDGGSKQ